MLGINLTLNNVALAARTLTQKAVAILRSFGSDAHVYMPGVGWMNGLTAGNYLESTGQTPVSVDSPVGLALDGMGSAIVPAVGDFGVSSGYDNTLTLVTPAGFTTTSGATTARVYVNLQTVVGRIYTLRGMLPTAGANGVVVYALDNYNGNGTILANTSTIASGQGFSLTFTAANSVSCFLFIAPTVGQSFSTSGLAITTGIAATQATTANKPILRRGTVNLLTYSGVFSNAAWVAGGDGSFAFGSSVEQSPVGITATSPYGTYTGSGWQCYQAKAVVNTPMTLAVWAKATVASRTLRLFLNDSQLISDNVLTSDWQLVLLSGTVGGTLLGSGRCGFRNKETWVNGDVLIGGAALFKGTYTAAQIQALGGIPLTTTAPASTAQGNYFWEFDGSNDSLSLGSSPLTTASDHFVVTAFSANSNGVNQVVYGGSSSVSSQTLLAQVYVDATDNKIKAAWRNDSASEFLILVPSASYVHGSTVVVTAARIGTTCYLWINGTLAASGSIALTGTTSNIANIGVTVRLGVTSFPLNGKANYVNPVQGTITEPIRNTLEKFAASVAGVTI